MAGSFRIVNIGDSIPWGQGLLENEKYDTQVAAALGASLQRFAHSGAVIDASSPGGAANGEVPESHPTILEQCDAFTDSAGTVDLVLVDGGINDVGVATILNPLAIVPALASRIVIACHDRMLTLLQKVSAKFTKPSCKILVTGYYVIISSQSDPIQIPKMLSVHGIALPEFVPEADFFGLVINRCEQFATDSATQLQNAIRDAHDARITFVPSGFTDANAVFVPGTSLLWGLDDLLNPEDPVAAQRHRQCDITFGQPLEILNREQCYRASAGHPNVAGAAQFAREILSAIH